MRIFVSQLNPTIGDLKGNTNKVLYSLEQARLVNAELILFSELILSGYPPKDLLLQRDFIEAHSYYLKQIVEASSGLIVILGLVRQNKERVEKSLINSAAVIDDGKLLGFQDKQLLSTYDVFDERRYFESVLKTRIWSLKGKRIGIFLCEDMWQCLRSTYTHDPVLDLADFQPDLVLNLSASPYKFQKLETHIEGCLACARTLKCPVVLCSQVGANDQLVFAGYSIYVNKQAKLQRLAKGFEEDTMLLDTEALSTPYTFTPDPFKDLYQALVLGVRDYFVKLGFEKACLGISGGIDSALTACIAVDALGKENVLGITMPSRYSSKQSLLDAIELAENLKILLKQIPIEKPFQAYLELLQPYFVDREFDVTEENLQARIRGAILMAFSNKLGYLVLSTSNKSEVAMGYCTLYGDMCGGLSVLSDVTKQQVYILANLHKQRIPRSTLKKPPSAELKPHQLDSDSLPPYDRIDQVLQGYMEERFSPEEISYQYQIPLDLVKQLIKRMHNAEYKRQQAAPGICVSQRAFQEKVRFPIVQKWI
ncbi:MAG: NAD+ synthase [Chlamydiales bacterium]|jgi:NAD+ synthase (glutamine-hydrolysing)|nr:NAD+ synthase [Chlamydiales bacterium]